MKAVGLADNNGIRFMCSTCDYFDDGICRNKHYKLNGTKVEPDWCCNLYDHDDMKVIIQ